MTNYPLIFLLLAILFCTGSFIAAILLKHSNSNKDKLLARMRAELCSLQGSPEEHESTGALFDENLHNAGLITRLQQPRLLIQQNSVGATAPERYRYIQSMAEMGLNAGEIASTLSMSVHETTQIMTLIKIANPGQQVPIKPLSISRAAVTDSPVATRVQPVEQGILRRFLAVEKPETVHTSPTPINQAHNFRSPTSCKKNKNSGGKAIKLARWLKNRALPPLLRKQSGREPPRNPLPGNDPLFHTPISGYT